MTITLNELIETKPSDSRCTPEWLMDLFKDYYDPCPLNPHPIIDGLKTEWKTKTYVNPPYSDVMPWVIKALEESKKGKLIVMLVKLDTTTAWFKLLMSNGAHLFYSGERLKFYSPIDKKFDSSPFPSALIILKKGDSK